MTESSPKGLKTLWEKEKLLVTSNFSFSHSVFKRHVKTRTCLGMVNYAIFLRDVQVVGLNMSSTKEIDLRKCDVMFTHIKSVSCTVQFFF